MAASYPTSVKSFTTKASDDTIQAAHVNDLQDEVTAIETALLSGGFAHNVILAATKKLYLDGGSNTYLVESAADKCDIVVGGTTRLRMDGATAAYVYGVPLVLDATKGLYLDGGSNTYLYESAADTITFVAGASAIFTVVKPAGEGYDITTGGYTMTTWPTTASAANAYVVDGGAISRSTSSKRYKTAIEPLDAARANATIMRLAAVTYAEKPPQAAPPTLPGFLDKAHGRRYPGFIAEEVAQVDPLLVTVDQHDEPDYVTYDRITAFLVPVVQGLERRVRALERQEAG